MAVTIKQIAQLANVSRGTVDKVLNHRPGVKEETKSKVLQIAKELGYQPNYLGKALVQIKNPVKIGIILTPDYNPFIQEMLKGIQHAKEEFSAFGIEIQIKMPISLEPAEQINILNDLERDKVNGIAIFPIDDSAVFQKVNQLIDNGVAVITFNSQVQGIRDFCFVGQDHEKGGRTAAGLMCKLLPEGGQVGIIISSYHLSCHQDRLQGFSDKLKEAASFIEIIDIQENQDKKEDAFRITLEYLNLYPNLKGIYITSGGVAGIGSALSLLDKNRQIIVICHDLVPDTLELLKNDTVDFALGQNPQLQGYQLVKILFDYHIRKQSPASNHFEIPITIATKDTI